MTAPKTAMRRIVLDLRQIHARCAEEADCMLWSQSTNSCGIPYAQHDGDVVSLRRLVWQLAHPGDELPSWAVVSPTCGNPRCLAVEHLPLRTRKQAFRQSAENGAYSSPAATAAKTAGRRRVAKLTMADARAIRAAESAEKAAKAHGISKSHAAAIRAGKSWRESIGGVFGVWGGA